LDAMSVRYDSTLTLKSCKNKVTCTNGKVTSSQQSKRQNCGGTSVGEAKKIELACSWGNDASVWARDRTAVKPCMWMMKRIRKFFKALVRAQMSWYNPIILSNQACTNSKPSGCVKCTAGWSKVGSLGFELITRRSLVRIQAPL
jgi:hypothetical protein